MVLYSLKKNLDAIVTRTLTENVASQERHRIRNVVTVSKKVSMRLRRCLTARGMVSYVAPLQPNITRNHGLAIYKWAGHSQVGSYFSMLIHHAYRSCL